MSTFRRYGRLSLTVPLISLLVLLAGCMAGPVIAHVGGVSLMVHVADSPRERAKGLQGFEDLDANEGMLFVWEDADVRSFSMKEVDFPIDVIFIGEDLLVSAIVKLDPGDSSLVSSPSPSRYVIECGQGWTDRHGIGPGSRFEPPSSIDVRD